jgi:hypothetical protein
MTNYYFGIYCPKGELIAGLPSDSQATYPVLADLNSNDPGHSVFPVRLPGDDPHDSRTCLSDLVVLEMLGNGKFSPPKTR